MAIDRLLQKLERVRRTSDGRWRAKCPAHNNRGQSLSIRDDGGKVLIHCFGGCETGDVLAAVGMTASDLFPPRVDTFEPGKRDRWAQAEVWRAVGFEAKVACIIAYDMAAGVVPSPETVERLTLAADRIEAAMQTLNMRLLA